MSADFEQDLLFPDFAPSAVTAGDPQPDAEQLAVGVTERIRRLLVRADRSTPGRRRTLRLHASTHRALKARCSGRDIQIGHVATPILRAWVADPDSLLPPQTKGYAGKKRKRVITGGYIPDDVWLAVEIAAAAVNVPTDDFVDRLLAAGLKGGRS